MKDNSAQIIAEKISEVACLDKSKVLEIGCGDGRITSLLVGKTKELTAIDPDKKLIDNARKQISGAKFQIGTGEDLSFSDEYFDFVIFTLSLHHQNSFRAIKEAARVLATQGTLIVIEPVIDGEVERVFSTVHNEDQEKLIAQQSIQKSGLKVKYSEYFTAEWVFNDKEDLSNSVFDFYNVPFDLTTEKRIYNLIGSKSEQAPIVLQDIMELKLLKKL